MKHLPLGNKNITGNGELPNMNITHGEQSKHKRNANSSSRYNCYESWDAEIRNDGYYTDDEGKQEIEDEERQKMFRNQITNAMRHQGSVTFKMNLYILIVIGNT